MSFLAQRGRLAINARPVYGESLVTTSMLTYLVSDWIYALVHKKCPAGLFSRECSGEQPAKLKGPALPLENGPCKIHAFVPSRDGRCPKAVLVRCGVYLCCSRARRCRFSEETSPASPRYQPTGLKHHAVAWPLSSGFTLRLLQACDTWHVGVVHVK